MSDSISELIKVARYQLQKAGFVDPAMMQGGGMPPGGAPPMDPSMMGGAPPMDPAMMGGAPPMDPSMMGGAPMDPAMMDPAMMGGAPMDPAMMGGGAPPPPAEGGSGDITETIRQIIKEELAASGGGGAKPKGSGGKVNMEADLAAIKSVLSQLAGVFGLQVPASTLLGGAEQPSEGGGEGSSEPKAAIDGRPMSKESRATIDHANRLVALLSGKHV